MTFSDKNSISGAGLTLYRAGRDERQKGRDIVGDVFSENGDDTCESRRQGWRVWEELRGRGGRGSGVDK